MGQRTVAREITFDDENLGPEVPLELGVVPRGFPRFVTGAAGANAPAIVSCPYCGAPGSGLPSCAACGAPARATLEQAPRVSRYAPAVPPAPPPEPSPSSPRGAFGDAVEAIPFAFWKRLPAYALLALVLGNGCLCGGLSGRTNATLALLIVVGVVGLLVALQRRP